MYINDLKYFANLRILKESKIISCDLEEYVNHHDKLREDFKIGFGDLDRKHVPQWFVTPLVMKIDNKRHESDSEHELIEMHLVLQPKTLFKSKILCEYWNNINTANMYPKL